MENDVLFHSLEQNVKDFLMERNVCLIGFMGSGKSFFGEILSKELGNKILDTDKLIENIENKTIYEIFKQKGESFFRAQEKKILQDIVYGDDTISKEHSVIIVTGGGLPLNHTNQKLLKQMRTFNICLNPPFEVILSRIKGSKRPLIYRHSRQYIFNLWSHRYSIYQKLADISIAETDINMMFLALNQRVKLHMNR